jgi:DNA-binding transcriptional ArsR family regulator
VNRRRADADVFQAIAHPIRRTVLRLLSDGEQPATALATQFDISVPAVSQHLRVLRDSGLVSERRAGRNRVYYITPEPLREVSQWVEHYRRFWTEKLSALEAYLDEQARARAPKKE